MSRVKEYKYLNSDTGKAIFNKKFNSYYCGLNQFSHRLGDAKIYHSDKYLNEAIKSVMTKNKLEASDLAIVVIRAEVLDKFDCEEIK